MPSPIISHQAPTFYLKIKFPKWIDGTAICIGALVPDMIFSIELRHVSHSLIGQLFWTVPLTIIFSMIFCRYFASILSNIANKEGFIPKILRYFAIDEWRIVKSKKCDKKFFLVSFYSAFIGGLTHLLLDFPSHPYIELFYPWVILPSFQFLQIPLVDLGVFTIGIWKFDAVITVSIVIWIVEDILLFISSLYLLRTIKKKDLLRSWYALKP